MNNQTMWADSLSGYRYLFFTGKGGVGKTSLSCAAALHLAEQGQRTLLVSTDPASNLDEVFGQVLCAVPQPVTGTANLWATNLDPEEAARAFREKAVAPYRGILPDAALRSIEEQFSGACTVEIAAFNEFTRLLGGGEVTDAFDVIIFDTAPTGHTLRLLSLPAAWSGFIDTNKSGVSCIGPLAQLQEQATLYRTSLDALQDTSRTTVVLVARPDRTSLKEAARASGEFAEMGIRNQRLILNGIYSAKGSEDAVAKALSMRAEEALCHLPEALADLPQSRVPLLPAAMVGLDALRSLLRAVPFASEGENDKPGPAFPSYPLEPLVAEVAARGHGVILTMGKGGVGKTTLAASIALNLVRQGYAVTLSTTDPAAHVAETVAGFAETLNGVLRVERIDPEAEVAAYRAEVMATAGAELDAEGRALLEEDLRSPCTEEIAVFRAFARAVEAGQDRFVVLDTAPTGHTILLLDAAEAYHREVLRTQAEIPDSVRTLLPRLRDPDYTHVFIVTLPEPTPVHEAARLQQDLQRAGIEPFAWVVNQSFAASGTKEPLLLAKAHQERRLIAEVEQLSSRIAVLPWSNEPLQPRVPEKAQ